MELIQSPVVDNGRLVLASLQTLMGSEAPIVVATVYDPSDGSGDAGRLACRPGRRGPTQPAARPSDTVWEAASTWSRASGRPTGGG